MSISPYLPRLTFAREVRRAGAGYCPPLRAQRPQRPQHPRQMRAAAARVGGTRHPHR